MRITKNFPSLRLLTVIALFTISSPAARAAVAIDPTSWGLSPGDKFRVIAVTYGTTAATSTNIGTYDTFVNTQGLDGVTYAGSPFTWQAVGQTPTSFAKTDTSRYSSQANATKIYNLSGQLVSDGNFWDFHNNAIDWAIDPSGNLYQFGGSTWVYTGFDYNGAPAETTDYYGGTVTSYLGQTATYTATDYETFEPIPGQTWGIAYGRTGASFNGWAWIGEETSPSTAYNMYAMSSEITVQAVPEPSTWALCAVGFAVVSSSFALRRGAWKRR